MLMYCKTASSYRTDNPLSRQDEELSLCPTQSQLLGNKQICRSIPGTSGQVHLSKRGLIPISGIARRGKSKA